MIFEKHCLIDTQLFWLVFNYSKFHAISHFVKYICKYENIVNYNIAHNMAIYQYLIKAFYEQTNKNEYKLQILQYNIYHTKIFATNDAVIVVKKGQKKPKQATSSKVDKDCSLLAGIS